MRIARLDLARSYALLKDQGARAAEFLTLQYRQLSQQYELVKAQRAQREAYQLALEKLSFIVGQTTRPDAPEVLESQRFFAEARRPSTPRSPSTTTRWRPSSTPRVRCCSTTTSSSPRANCPTAQGESGGPLREAQRRPGCMHAAGAAGLRRPARVRSAGPGPGPSSRATTRRPVSTTCSAAARSCPTRPRTRRRWATSWAPEADGDRPAAAAGPEQSDKTSTPPARPEKFGASQMLPTTPTVRDSAPSLMPW